MQGAEFYLCDSFYFDTFLLKKIINFGFLKIMFALFIISGIYPKHFER